MQHIKMCKPLEYDKKKRKIYVLKKKNEKKMKITSIVIRIKHCQGFLFLQLFLESQLITL